MIVNLKSPTDLSGFYIVYEGSTNIEKPGIYGISHLMEHLMCKNFDHLQDKFEEDGIDWNAYTSGNEIVFYIKGLDEKVNKWKYKFTELMSEFNVTKDQFENERKIVLEEYMDTFNDQMSSHYLNLERKIYDYYNPIGKRTDLESLKFMDCLNFFETQYMKPSKIINVSKNNDFKSNLIDFSDRKINKEYKLFENNKAELDITNTFKDKSSLIMKSNIVDGDYAKIHFLNNMLSGGLNSPFYQEIREKKGLVYFIDCSLSRMNDKGDINISTLTSNDNIDNVVETINEIFKNPDKYLTKERFDVVKESVKVNLKKQDINRYSHVSRWINPEGWSLSDIIDDIELPDIKGVFEKYYNVDDFYISNDKTEFSQQQ